ncbi:hypothetical protein B7P43_G11733 [Cryptotermes secundus]|uniref:DUF4371 domain-containing protein n=1 Tax=Cryptotermes secundus TaxID=105785 RepID=A0A2J7PE93_9NEOP|nr:hypothetical protein B7P43_G11733 [Cryptotermes secundus]
MNVKRDNEADVKASYVIAELIAKNSKCFSESEFLKECLVKTADIVCPDKVQIFKNISLSRNTVAEKVDDIATNLSEQLLAKVERFTAFSIAVDESSDVSGVAQLAVFIRACDTDVIITEELLDIISLGEDIFNEVYGLLEKYDLPLSKSMPPITAQHCIIHQEFLCSKIIKMNYVLQFVEKVVNFIRSRGLNQRQFSSLLSAEVRCLSCYSVLKRFSLLREEAFKDLNLKLQGKRYVVISLYDSIKDFKLKLKLWEGRMKNGNLIHFPICQDYKKSHSNSDFTSYISQVKELINDF